jgi:thiosulfate/3-mercaptopyruvate sulfurtransferase
MKNFKFKVYKLSIALIVAVALFSIAHASDCTGNVCSESENFIRAVDRLPPAQDIGQNQYSSNISDPTSPEHANKSNDQVNLSITANESWDNLDKFPVNTTAPEREGKFAEMLAPLSSVSSSNIIIDISPNASEYIDGAIHIPYTDFSETGGNLDPISNISKILGDAGISRDDSVIIYGECLPCGGGPSASTYVYWVLRYLGHDNVRVLDGGINDWTAAGLPTEALPATRPKTNYTPVLRPDLLASYDFVKNGGAQIIDARTQQEHSDGSITGSVNIPYEEVLDNGRIKGEAALKDLFINLEKDKPVVVYTNNGVKASMIWFALETMGYDARIYSWQDWLEYQPLLNLELTATSAEPNPVSSGSVVRIAAIIRENNQNTTIQDISGSTAPFTPSNETILTIKGCASCGFGGFPRPDTSSGVAQIGNTYRKPSDSESSDSKFSCTAIITNSDEEEVGSVNMQRTSGDEFAGTWKANVDAGVYKVTIIASTPGITRTFRDVLEIEVAGSGEDATVYKKLGTY